MVGFDSMQAGHVEVTTERGGKMKTTKEVGKQEAKVLVLKCERCGEEYIYDSYTRICPACGAILQKGETIMGSGDINKSIR